MKSAFVLFVMGVGAAALAQPVTAQPAATQPAMAPTVLIAPLTPPGSGRYPWLGRQIARDLATSVANASRAKVNLDETPAPDAQAARQAATSRGDSVAVFGAAQASGNQVRVTGQVIDANTGATLGALNATATADDLFPLEDQLAGQVLKALPKNWLYAPPTVAAQVSAAATTQPAYAAANLPQYQSYTYPDYAGYPPGYTAPYEYYSYPSAEYDYTYAYPNYWWYEPYPYYGPVYYYGYWGHHFDGDHDWDDHFGRPWRHGSFEHFGRGFGSHYAPHGPEIGHIHGEHFGGGGHLGGEGHGGGHEGR